MKKSMWLIKCLGFTLSFSILTCIVSLLEFHSKISDKNLLVMLFVLCIVAAPLYPVVKGEVSHPLLYNAVAMLAHIIFNVATCLAFNNIIYVDAGWDALVFPFVGFYMLLFFAINILFDTVVYGISKIVRSWRTRRPVESK